MLYLVGLGLGTCKDLTYRAVEAVKLCEKVYLESYTSFLIDSSIQDLQDFLGVQIEVADRQCVEGDFIFDACKNSNVALLVAGDPLSATTHSDMVVRCHEKNIQVQIIHNASVMTVVGVSGLQLYRFGETVSLCFWTNFFKPDSWYDKILANKQRGLHSLCLLDIKMKELTEEQIVHSKSRSIFDDAPPDYTPPPPRFMTVAEAIEQLLAVESIRKCGVCDVDSLAVGLARLGSEKQKIVAGSLKTLATVDFGGPLHSFILCGSVSEPENEHLQLHFQN